MKTQISPEYRILFVDDSWERFEKFAESLPDSITHFHWAGTAQKAFETLDENPKFDVICLDHDMGEGQACGCAVVDYVASAAQKKKFKDTQFLIHSWNPAGAEAMHNALTKAGLKSKIKPYTNAVREHID